jgi:ribosomal-protein-alanine N-acetyltransferase
MAALDADCALTPWTTANLARYCEHDGYYALVSLRGGELWGFLLYSRLVDEASLDNVVVSRERRGAGLGKALLRSALTEMTKQGLSRCVLDVRESNTAARGLYEKAGFGVDGVRPRYYVTGQGREDAVLMSRRL